jgi:hypothetical protein
VYPEKTWGAVLFYLALRPATEAKAMSKQLIPASGGKTLAQFRTAYGISERSWKRLKAAGDIPRRTWITSNKSIIRPEHEQAWLDARTDPAPAASPFPTE